MNWALATGPHPGENLPSLRGRHSGHKAQLTHTEGPDQVFEVFLCLSRKMQQRGFEGEVERFRHERSQIVLVIGKAQNELDPEGSS
ncbi:MAG TPA: hypothetical protein VIS99_15470 [Terrimicrobiaceae bacterium]